MHYYQFNIGDYASHTRHLEPMEDLIYRRLLDLYYLHESPLNDSATTVAKQIGLRDEAATVREILNEFFERTDEGYRSSRADKEIAHYHSKIEQASRAGKASAERRNNARPTDVQPNNKQEPINKNQEKKATAVATPDGVSESVWKDFVALRKSKKAAITETAIKGLQREAQKAKMSLEQVLSICCERGWAGFKADWMTAQFVKPNSTDVVRQTTPTPDHAFDALRKIEQDRKKATPMPANIREKINGMLKLPAGKDESVGDL